MLHTYNVCVEREGNKVSDKAAGTTAGGRRKLLCLSSIGVGGCW